MYERSLALPVLLAGSAIVLAAIACGGSDGATDATGAAGSAGGGAAAGSGGSAGLAGSGGAGDAAAPVEDAGAGDAGAMDAGPPLDRCAVIKASVAQAGFDAKVTVTCDGTFAYLESDTYPDHELMTGITGTNEQVPVPAPGYKAPVALVPTKAATPLTRDAALGTAVNGVPIYDYTSAGMNDLTTYDPKLDTKATGQLDHCNGHAGRGDDYHYHASPTCMIDAMKNKGPDAIVGWGFDGYPVYGDTNPDGSAIAPGELDTCNGKADPTFGYRYHTSQTHPYILQCLVGAVQENTLPRVPPFPGKPTGVPPQGGVQNLTLTEDAAGVRTMTYSYMGASYYIQYQPGTTAGCWDFEEKTVTNGGVVTKSSYCRMPQP